MTVEMFDENGDPYTVEVPMDEEDQSLVGETGQFYWDDDEFCWQFSGLI